MSETKNDIDETEITSLKNVARAVAMKNRNTIKDRDSASSQIKDLLLTLPAIQQASCICCYVSFRSEVETHNLIQHLFELNKQILVPWCNRDDLELFQIETLNELKPGTFGILEPPVSIRENKLRQKSLSDAQVALIPGLAFTASGRKRLGYGRGYYDRLLSTSPATKRIALAFDDQIIDEVPATERDVAMELIVTESRLIGKLR